MDPTNLNTLWIVYKSAYANKQVDNPQPYDN